VKTFLGEHHVVVFDADRCAHELLEQDAGVAEAVRSAFGDSVFGADGKPDRLRLRDLVFAESSRRQALEAILHPVIRDRWFELAAQSRESKTDLLVDLPLLFETAAETAFDRTIVVACSASTQQRRLRENRGLDQSMVEKIIDAQLPLGAKIKKADHVVWNDSSISCLEAQTRILSRWLTEYYG